MDENVSGQPNMQADVGAEAPAATPQVPALDSLSEFEFQGEKYTPDRLQEVLSGYKTLSEKQRAYADEERYVANLDADLESVVENPNLAEKFRQIYPKKFHFLVDKVLRSAKTGDLPSQNNQAIPKEFLNEFGQLKQGYQTLQQQMHQYAVEAANAKIDAILPKLIEKYPMAEEDQILTRAEGFVVSGGKLTEQTWERIVRESHEKAQKKADAFYKRQLQSQVEKGRQAQDAGPGGATPGQAPKKIKTFAEAEKAMMEHLKANGY